MDTHSKAEWQIQHGPPRNSDAKARCTYVKSAESPKNRTPKWNSATCPLCTVRRLIASITSIITSIGSMRMTNSSSEFRQFL